jgi:hypothetical protein
MGGMDRWLLPNCHPLALGRIYALFLTPELLYLFVIGINVILVFIFSFKIQTEFLGTRRWMAYIGAIVAVITEGYWTGKFPESHICDGHGFTVIIVGIYWLTRFHQSAKFWMVALLVGISLALGSWMPFHNLPPLLVTITIWGLVFWAPGAWIKVIKMNALIILTVLTILLPQFLAIKLLYTTTGRSEIYWPTVDLNSFYSISNIIVFGILGILGIFLKIFQQKTTKQALAIFLLFSTVPAIAYIFQILKIIPAFRWEVLYAGNEAWLWLAVIFFIDKIQQAIENRWYIGGVLSRVLICSVWYTLIAFAWMNSLWFDLYTSYPSGTWRTLTETSISSALKKADPHQPVRVVGIDDTNDMHFWGQYQGLESMLGYASFIDQRLMSFWWAHTAHGPDTTCFLSIPIPVPGHYHFINFPVSLSALINPDALKLTNVHWIISHHPLYPMPGLQTLLDHPGQPMACTQWSPPLIKIDLKNIKEYWEYIGCLVKDYRYDRPLYVYNLTDALPRAYLALDVLPWPSGQFPVLNKQQLALAAQKNAFVDSRDWLPTHHQQANGTVNFDDYQSDYMRLKISTRQDALLVIASTLNPYWRVLVDHHSVRSFDVNGFQEGFWVHPKNQSAELIYCPPWRPQQHPYCSKR